MGVLACNRNNCTNIMCDTCVSGQYYICDECKEEFKKWISTQQPLYLDSRQFLYEKFEEFMSIEKDIHNIPDDYEGLIDEFFDTYQI